MSKGASTFCKELLEEDRNTRFPTTSTGEGNIDTGKRLFEVLTIGNQFLTNQISDVIRISREIFKDILHYVFCKTKVCALSISHPMRSDQKSIMYITS